MSVEGLLGTDDVFAADLQALRPQPGQAFSAGNMRAVLADSPIRDSHRDPAACTRVQDAYSLRCAPQVHGGARDTVEHAATIAGFYDRWLDAVPGEVPGMRDLFLGLTGRMPVYGISNFSRELFDRTLPVYPFLSAFTGLVLSGDENLTKPDARIYRLLCERYGLPPERCMFIDDSPANVDAARGVGMKAHTFTDAASLVPVLRAEGFAV